MKGGFYMGGLETSQKRIQQPEPKHIRQYHSSKSAPK